ncbi:hypothetical protein JIQ42_02975 [Leishmania sp. Namibia]|uniref:hypothetical protein n=1 Tax=Leishmania sp. Namibia TaxID=2802991 RepID=UPI001B408358|nr:hypothetical protein JIQ42_02975 [Leishmania sp. Namibia]
MSRGGPDTVTETSALVVTHGETADGCTSCGTPQVRDRSVVSFVEDVTITELHAEMSAIAGLEKDDDGERLSQSSADSWVELTPAELGATLGVQRTPIDVSVCTRVMDVAQPLALHSSVPKCVEEVAPSQLAPKEPSPNELRINVEANVSALTQFMMDDAATMPFGNAETAAEEVDPEQLSSSSPEAADLNDDLASVDCDEAQSRLTVNVDPDSMMRVSESGVAASPEGMVGVTEVLRRRLIQEDLLRTERGPSGLPPEERAAVLQALFGDFGNVPISAEKFREVMVPYQRHCECLGASYGFHHQGCRFFTDFPVSL